MLPPQFTVASRQTALAGKIPCAITGAPVALARRRCPFHARLSKRNSMTKTPLSHTLRQLSARVTPSVFFGHSLLFRLINKDILTDFTLFVNRISQVSSKADPNDYNSSRLILFFIFRRSFSIRMASESTLTLDSRWFITLTASSPIFIFMRVASKITSKSKANPLTSQ